MTAAPKDQPALDKALLRSKASLEKILGPPATVDQVKTALEADGLTHVEVAGDATTGIAYWAEVVNHLCLFGEIALDSVLKVEVGGFMPDGGCRLVTGH